jgi:BrxA
MATRNRTRYNLSFTAASLRPELARVVAECYLAANDWGVAKNRILSSNALQCRSAGSLVRLERELRQRIARLTPEQIALLARATSDDRAAMAWLAAQKHCSFIFEFAAEVLREKLSTHDPILRQSDYETYVESKSVGHPELAQLASVSKNKIRQVLLRMLAEAGLMSAGAALGKIQRPTLSEDALRSIINDSRRWLAGFLIPDSEIGSL